MAWGRWLVLTTFMTSGFVACSTGGGFYTDDAGRANDGDGSPNVVDTGTSRDARADTSTEQVPEDASVQPKDAKAKDTSNSGTQCVSNCTTDQECQLSCPAAPFNGINCCDTSSGVCYASSTSSCGAVDGGFD